MKVRFWAVCLLWIASFGSLTCAASAEALTDWNQQFQQHITHWIDDLSAKDEQFAVWKGARTEVQGLGVHSHQWLVRLSKDGSYVGYLIVGEEQNPEPSDNQPTFVLLEYGLGEFILFHDAFAPLPIAAEPVYDGFASHWEVTLDDQQQQYIDAKTGERYPATINRSPALVMPTLSARDVVRPNGSLTHQRIFSRTETDPFDRIDWVKAAPLSIDERDGWKTLLNSQQQRYVVIASLFHDQVFAPFSVGTIHVWDDSVAYIGVWDEGLRFLPMRYVTKVGDVVAGG